MSVYESVKNYYGKVLAKSGDLKTNACTTKPTDELRPILSLIHPEVLSKYYGCGLIAPKHVKGMRILDLGSGSGRDVYVLSNLVGQNGYVVGLDMTEEQVEVANKYIQYHTEAFGYAKPNVEFRIGYMEQLDGFEDNSFDIVISNCVINLSPDKERVFKEVWRVLKPGGEFYFSDVYSDKRIPQKLIDDAVLFGECLSGALYWNDYISIVKKVGFVDPRLVESSLITVKNKEIEAAVGNIGFFSATTRLFKLPELEPYCEDYGQAVIFKGFDKTSSNDFILDEHHRIPVGKVFPVCGNTWNMLNKTRFKDLFEFIGDSSRHFGPFEGCGVTLPSRDGKASGSTTQLGGCC